MKYLLIGGAGFIGSHTLSHLLSDKNNSVTVYDNFCTGREWHIKKHKDNPNFKLIKGDIEDLGTLEKAMQGIDIAYHFAANADIAKATTDPSIDFWDGTLLTNNVLEAMRKTGTKRIVYTSGSGVYGDLGEKEVIEDRLTMLPISPYGASKLGSEGLISAYSHMFDIKAIIYRFANVVGPNQTHGVGYDFAQRLMKNTKELTILGDGTQTKSYLYIYDVVNAITMFNDKSWNKLEIYNVATNNYITVTEIAEIAVKLLDLEGVNFKYSGGKRGWKGDVPKIVFNTDKLRSRGWQNKFTTKQAIEKSIQSIINNAKQGRYEEF